MGGGCLVFHKTNSWTPPKGPIRNVNEVDGRTGIIVPIDQTAGKKHVKKPVQHTNIIKTAIKSNKFISKIIKDDVIDEIVKTMYLKEFPPDEKIIKQGENGSHMYVSIEGQYQVLINDKLVTTFSDQRVFGELAILLNAKRVATIRSVTACKVYVLDQNIYQRIVYEYNLKKEEEIISLLMANEKLNVVSENVLRVVATLLNKEEFEAGVKIVKQGDRGNAFYIIKKGTVTVTKQAEGKVGVLKEGDCFGELALLLEDCRQATVTANPPGVECLVLSRRDFINYFGEVSTLQDVTIYKRASSAKPLQQFQEIQLNDLKSIATIGVGGFGRVELVRYKRNKKLIFALKKIKKVEIVERKQQEHIFNEKDVQMNCNSPFIVKLYKTFKDNKFVYFLMEACTGGDLFKLLQEQRNRRFREADAKFICGCVLLAIEYMHERNIIYRDLKPENLLIDSNGYVKLTDFGFAKKLENGRKSYTTAGTPEYIAVEVVQQKSYDRAVDYWAFGVLVYEMLCGRTPFKGRDDQETFDLITNGIYNVRFPPIIGPAAKNLVQKLCKSIPRDRLGMQKNGVGDIKSHPWFNELNWNMLQNLAYNSPFKPNPNSKPRFDEFKPDTDLPPDETSGWDEDF